jgi:hypothetical protein
LFDDSTGGVKVHGIALFRTKERMMIINSEKNVENRSDHHALKEQEVLVEES